MTAHHAPGPDESGGSTPADRTLTAEQHAEYERLRRAAGVRHRRLRGAGASILLVLALVLAPLAVVAAWVQDTVSDTDRYVQTVAPLASDPAVQEAVTDRLTARVVANLDVEAITDSLGRALADAGAPPRVVESAQALAGPLRSAATTVVHRTVSGVITSDAFPQVWEGANRRAHAAVLAVLTGEGEGALGATGDAVQLNLGPVVDQVRERLVDAGFERAAAIPDTDRTITLFRTEKLDRAQDAMLLLNVVGTWLPVLTVLLAALAVLTAVRHRLMLLITALGTAATMGLLLVALAVVRRIYLDSVPGSALPPDAAAAIFDTFLRFLRDSTRTLLVVGLLTAIAAYLYGPGRFARGVRRTADRGATAVGRTLGRTGLSTGATGRWAAAHRGWITGVVIGAGALALVLWNHPTVGAVVLVLVLVLVVLAVVAVYAALASGPGAGEKRGVPA
ncbi:hypothetical protein [Streptomyces viridosporus]|uniref:hypothetical protein n=1 Tax=Streptomyces viridosporus TaxID=67581 RepID=UPI0009BF9756|nr:hypothetical protein [Streptomyces viridosporus]